MGIDIAGAQIVKNASNGISLNMLAFNSSGVGTANPLCGFSGWKAGSDGLYYAAPWQTNNLQWLSPSQNVNGYFTCPVDGIYALGFSGIVRGGSGFPAGNNTYGYAGYVKNGGVVYYTHWNLDNGRDYWGNGGQSALFSCAAGDTLSLFVNYPPTPYGPNVHAQNLGMYPESHHALWCKLVG